MIFSLSFLSLSLLSLSIIPLLSYLPSFLIKAKTKHMNNIIMHFVYIYFISKGTRVPQNTTNISQICCNLPSLQHRQIWCQRAGQNIGETRSNLSIFNKVFLPHRAKCTILPANSGNDDIFPLSLHSIHFWRSPEWSLVRAIRQAPLESWQSGQPKEASSFSETYSVRGAEPFCPDAPRWALSAVLKKKSSLTLPKSELCICYLLTSSKSSKLSPS